MGRDRWDVLSFPSTATCVTGGFPLITSLQTRVCLLGCPMEVSGHLSGKEVPQQTVFRMLAANWDALTLRLQLPSHSLKPLVLCSRVEPTSFLPWGPRCIALAQSCGSWGRHRESHTSENHCVSRGNCWGPIWVNARIAWTTWRRLPRLASGGCCGSDLGIRQVKVVSLGPGR